MIEHDVRNHLFHTALQGHQARLEYRLDGASMTITHTLVPEAIGGQGIAAALTKATLEHARSTGLAVVAQCSYAQTYLSRHPQYQDLVQE